LATGLIRRGGGFSLEYVGDWPGR